jgi:hypothetical protein
MEIFNIGPLEFLLVVILVFVIMGPQGTVETARKMGQLVYKIIHSPLWSSLMKTTQEIKDIPVQIVREAGLEENIQRFQQEQQKLSMDINRVVVSPEENDNPSTSIRQDESESAENQILPPSQSSIKEPINGGVGEPPLEESTPKIE